MKVTLISGSAPEMSCGIGDYSARLAEALGRLGVDVTLVTSRDVRVVAGEAFRVEQLTARWGVRQLRSVVVGVLATHPDVIHLQYPSAGYRHGVAAGLLVPMIRGLSPGSRLVATLHEYRHMHPLHRLFVAVTLPWAHSLVTPDQSQIATMPSALRRGVVEIPNGSNLVAFPQASRSDSPGSELVIGTWGMLRHDKGVDLALEAFEVIAGERPTRFILAGDPGEDLGYIGELDRRLEGSSFAEHITRTGRLSPQNLAAVIRSFDACVLPYRNGLEPNRGTYAAAVAAGVYVVTTSHERRGFDPATNTCFVAPGDRAALVEGIKEAPRHPRRAPRDAFLDWLRIAEAHLKVYADVIERTR